MASKFHGNLSTTDVSYAPSNPVLPVSGKSLLLFLPQFLSLGNDLSKKIGEAQLQMFFKVLPSLQGS